MSANKVSSRSKNSKNDDKSADSLEMERQRLKREISELQTLITQVECQNMDLTKFSDITNVDQLLTSTSKHRISTKVPDLNVMFRREMHSYAGFYCVKVTEGEYVINFACNNGERRGQEIFSVQIFNNDGKGSLGNWVMPMSVDMEKILAKTPIDSLVMVVPFLKNCKRHVDCYAERRNQYKQTKDHFSDKNNCEIDANLGFTSITLRLLGIYNKSKDSYFDLTIQLPYKSNETRPCAIGVDWSLRKDPTPSQENEMKNYAKFLRNQRILEGFRHMTEAKHPVFEWAAEEYVNSPLELNNSSLSSGTDEDSIALTAKRKRKKLTRKRQRVRELRERWKKRQRQTSVAGRSQDRDSTDDDNEEQSVDNRNSERTRSSDQSRDGSRSPKSSEEPPRTRRTSRIVAQRNTKAKPTRKLRQSTISFPVKQTNASKEQNSTNVPAKKIVEVVVEKSSNAPNAKATKSSPVKKKKLAVKAAKESQSVKANSLSARTKKSAIPVAKRLPVGILSAKKINRAATSTPLRTRGQSKVKFSTTGDIAISPIASADENEK